MQLVQNRAEVINLTNLIESSSAAATVDPFPNNSPFNFKTYIEPKMFAFCDNLKYLANFYFSNKTEETVFLLCNKLHLRNTHYTKFLSLTY